VRGPVSNGVSAAATATGRIVTRTRLDAAPGLTHDKI